MNNVQENSSMSRSFWDNGHFFRDFSLVLIFFQIAMEFTEVMANFDSMTYTVVIISSAIGDVFPFLFKMCWCLLLIAMFLFTLGGTSRWPLVIQMFITIGLMVQYYVVQDYLWLGALSFSLIIYMLAIREAKRRAVRQYISELYPHEKEMPLWIMIVAFVILNIGFTLPAYEKYNTKMTDLKKEYEEMMSFSKMVENVKKGANNVSQEFMNSETMRMVKYYMDNMFIAPGDAPSYKPSVVNEPVN